MEYQNEGQICVLWCYRYRNHLWIDGLPSAPPHSSYCPVMTGDWGEDDRDRGGNDEYPWELPADSNGDTGSTGDTAALMASDASDAWDAWAWESSGWQWDSSVWQWESSGSSQKGWKSTGGKGSGGGYGSGGGGSGGRWPSGYCSGYNSSSYGQRQAAAVGGGAQKHPEHQKSAADGPSDRLSCLGVTL